jgi:site-specific DNA-adenine methylase
MEKVMKGFLPWQGCKSRLAGQISSLIGSIDHGCYVEHFMGAEHVFIVKE